MMVPGGSTLSRWAVNGQCTGFTWRILSRTTARTAVEKTTTAVRERCVPWRSGSPRPWWGPGTMPSSYGTCALKKRCWTELRCARFRASSVLAAWSRGGSATRWPTSIYCRGYLWPMQDVECRVRFWLRRMPHCLSEIMRRKARGRAQRCAQGRSAVRAATPWRTRWPRRWTARFCRCSLWTETRSWARWRPTAMDRMPEVPGRFLRWSRVICPRIRWFARPWCTRRR